MAMRDKIEHAIQNQPCTVKDLKNKFGGDRGADRKVMEAVDQLVHEAVICQRQGVFFTVRSGRADKALLCKVVKLGKNFAFVMLEDGTSDIFIPGRFTRGAMPGDKVLVEKFAHPRVEGSDEGEILAVLEEKNSLVGTMHRVEGRLKFVPDDCPAISMQVMRDCEGSAKDGDKVAVEILLRGNRQEDHRVGVAMRFGSCDEAKRCAKALLYAQDIRNRFPDKVRDEAKKLDNAEVSAADCEGRMDLRALPIFTIDSAETKDIDDAISLTKTPDGGFELGVHIADVSNYVKPGSELDNEAFNRATSVYYADQVVPMLPKQLSNGICSLNEGVLRLAFSCLMRLDKDGNLVGSYDSIDKAIQEAADGATVQVIKAEATTKGINLDKNLTIEGVASTTKKQDAEGNVVETTEKPKLIFEDKGIALWSKSLAFKNMQVVLNNIGTTPYTAEWNWSTVCASKDSTLTLDNTDMTLDGTGTASNVHAIYFTGNDKLNIQNGSNLTIQNYKQDALEWDGGDGGYNVNITNGSSYTSDHNRSGFTGTFYVTVDDSTVKVLNSTGNGSNGSHFDIKNGSDVEFSNNGSHGLSAGNLNIEDSTVTASNNGLTGITFTGKGSITDSTVTVTGTKGLTNSHRYGYNAGLRLGSSSATLDIKNSTVTVADNYTSGIL